MTETVPSSGRGGTAAAMAQNEQTTEEHSTLEQQSPGMLSIVGIEIRRLTFGLLIGLSRGYKI